MKMDEINSSLVQSTLGDVNNDQTVDLNDAIISLRVLAGINDSNIFLQADIDNDGRKGLGEVGYILQILSGVRTQ